MARKAEFTFNGKSFFAELHKVDRKKLYGWSDIEVNDLSGRPCKLAGLAEGRIVLPSGSTSLLTLDGRGEEIDKSKLVGFDKEGKEVSLVPSIYDEKVLLRESNIDEYLLLAVKSVYQISSEESIEIFDGEKIFYFVFNYRADFEGDDAFLIKQDDYIFAVTGKIVETEFVGLSESEEEVVTSEEVTEDDGDDLDFAMF